MKESTSEERVRDIHVRPNAGIERSPLDEIKAIRTLLADVYTDAGDGRTLFRELVQNADDARAQQIKFVVLERGLRDTRNPLLHERALLVANDGAFSAGDQEALHRALGGSKENEVDKIGTFGIGLKSVFHICEALLYVGAEKSVWRAGVLNPWAGTGESGDADPLHPTWDKIDEPEVKRLRSVMIELLGGTNNGLLLWIPLRLPEHLDRGAEGRQYGLGERYPRLDELYGWFGSSVSAALLMAQCGHLRTIDAERAATPDSLGDRVRLVRVERQAVGWVGRYQDDGGCSRDRTSTGAIDSGDRSWSVVVTEARGSESLRQIRSQSDWPQTPRWQNGRYSSVPRKALAHAAVTVLRSSDSGAELSGVRLRWAVFLPLDDDPEPASSTIVESQGHSPAWEIILHGYFWPSQDRRSIPGVTDDIGNAAHDDGMRIRWNHALCEELLLPILPSALANAVDGVDERAVRRLLDAVVSADLVKNRLASVKQWYWLLPTIAAGGVRWKSLAARSCPVLSIRNWSQAPEVVRRTFVASCDECTDGVVFIDDDAPRFADELDDWTEGHLERLLNCIPEDAFGSPQTVRWIEGIVRHVLGPDASGGDTRAATIARWLAKRIGDGALSHTTRPSASLESRDELRNTWRNLCAALPKAWLVETPVDSQQAVAELAAMGVIGEGFFPMPFGRDRSELPSDRQLDQERIDRALSALGHWLRTGRDSGRLRHSRLLLAEVLICRRDDRPMGGLDGLPLMRAMRYPKYREEPWSIAELRRRIESCRVFATPVSEVADHEGTDGIQLDQLSAPKQAVMNLATALNKPVWLVSGEATATLADAPSPTYKALVRAVLSAEAFADAAHRKPLLMRLAREMSGDAEVRLAARALLAGRAADVVGPNTELFHDRTRKGRALRILLRLLDRSWCAVQGSLVESLPQSTLEDLSVGQADHHALHRLLGECLDKPVDWTGLSDEEALQVLRDLYGGTNEEQDRWRRMPLHRGVDGTRGAVNQRARRSTGTTGKWTLPPELQAEVRLLDPESQVTHLYNSVPEMDRDGLLQLMLEDSHPWRFAEWIVRSMRPSEGQVILPPDGTLRDLLRRNHWLPQRDGDGVAPDAVLLVPKILLDAVAGLAQSGAFRGTRLPEAVDPEIWEAAEAVVREILGRLSRERQLQRLVDALDSNQVGQVDRGAWLVMPNPDLVDASLVGDALQTALTGSHRGWKLIHAAARPVGRYGDPSQDSPEPLVKLAKVLCGPMPPERQTEILTSVADARPARSSPGGRVFRRYLECFAETDDFLTQVLPKLDLPTQDGNWHAGRDIARTETGVARRHRLIPELRPILQLDSDDPVTLTGHVANDCSGSPLETLERYFEPWHGRLPHGAVGAFLSLLGSGLDGVIVKLAEQWLGEDVSIEGVRSRLVGPSGQDPCADVSVWISPQVSPGDRVSAVNVLGSCVEMEAEPDDDTLFTIDPVPYPQSQTALAPLGAFWQIALRDVEPQSRSGSELMRLLGGTVERWASRYLKLDREQVNAWWSHWGKGSPADLGPVLASIKAHLPLTLQQLDVKEVESLRNALREAERAQRKREQAPSEETLKIEREALDHLVGLIDEPQHQKVLWKRVNELMRRYGYGCDSVLLELAQNADDALAEAAEIKGGPLPPATRRLLIRVHEHDGTWTVDIVHWGRPINDTGGAAFPAGRERQWDQDLYFMMLMNLSGKPGEAPGESSSSSTTGRFGLGFKSVHLISPSPSVVSGFTVFSIAGGLLPQEQAVAEDTDSLKVKGRQPTRVRLPLRPDVDAYTLIQRLFGRFSYARALLPVFARQVREVVVEGGPFPGVHVFNGKPIDGAPGWSVSVEIALPNHVGRWRVLRFRPADAGQEGLGTAALAIGLREGVPTAFGPGVPFLWNVTPTSESWGCGYVVNGPFKLDPGRTHVSLDDDTTLRAVGGLGEALGRGLIELHDVLVELTDASLSPLANRDGRGFLSSLWKILARGLNNADTLRHGFLTQLHGKGRGVSAWMAARSVVPTGLPAPFQPLLPPLNSGISWGVAVDGLDDPDLCAALTEIEDDDFARLVDSRRIVSKTIWQLLRPLCNFVGTEGDHIRSTLLRPCDLLAELVERWNYFLTPARLHALRPLSQDSAWNLISNDPHGATWRRKIHARSADGRSQPLRELLMRETSQLQASADGNLDDEFLRSAFAPNNRILRPDYFEHSEDRCVFRRLREAHRVDPEEIANWYTDLEYDLRPAAVGYLLNGELQERVLSYLVRLNARPLWLRDYDDVRRILEDLCEEPWRRQRLLGALFPDRFHPPEEPRRPNSETFFQQLSKWWDDATVRDEVISASEKHAWPEWLRRDGIAGSLQADSVDHWLALLVLGACRSLGRAQDQQHRCFLELVHEEGWWGVFKTPDDTGAWMEMLRDWQDDALAKLTYPRWMSLFPAIYQISRYRHVYVRLLKSAGQRSESTYKVTRLLAPRVDEALTGAGTYFDAPPAPLNIGVHWVLRELVRLEVIEGEHLFPDCWVPSERVIRSLLKFVWVAVAPA